METILKIDNIEKYYGNKSNMTKAIIRCGDRGVRRYHGRIGKW